MQVVAFDFARKFEASNFAPFLKGHISGNMTLVNFLCHSHQLRDVKENKILMVCSDTSCPVQSCPKSQKYSIFDNEKPC